jgi:hypothetical protein
MSNKEIDFKDQLMMLRAMTIRTGSIHEAQALQLKMWPLLIPNVVKAEAKVDAERKIVSFICESTSNRATKKVTNTCKHIAEWTKQLLWAETTVTIKINDKLIFDSRNKNA